MWSCRTCRSQAKGEAQSHGPWGFPDPGAPGYPFSVHGSFLGRTFTRAGATPNLISLLLQRLWCCPDPRPAMWCQESPTSSVHVRRCTAHGRGFGKSSTFGLEKVLCLTPHVSLSIRKGFMSVLPLPGQIWFLLLTFPDLILYWS